MTNIRFALVGVGAVAKRYGDMLSQGVIEGAELAAVCDKDSTRAEASAAAWRCKPYTSLDEMLRAERVDAACVLTDSGSHAALALQLLPNVRDVAVEKPMALRLEDADAMIACAAKHGARLHVVKQCRYNAAVIRLKQALNAGRFGRLVMGSVRVLRCRDAKYYAASPWRGTWAHDGGVLVNQASHHIDLLAWCLGEAESVIAHTATRLAKIEAEDTAIASVRFKNGALATIEATTCARPNDMDGSLTVLGENGSVVLGGHAADTVERWRFMGDAADAEERAKAEFGRNPKSPVSYAHEQYLKAVVRCAQTGEHPPVDGHEGRKSMDLIHAIYASAELGREVKLSEKLRSTKLGVR